LHSASSLDSDFVSMNFKNKAGSDIVNTKPNLNYRLG